MAYKTKQNITPQNDVSSQQLLKDNMKTTTAHQQRIITTFCSYITLLMVHANQGQHKPILEQETRMGYNRSGNGNVSCT